MTAKKQKYIIAGGGTAGWSAAAALSKFMQHVADIVLIESDEIRTIGVGEATIPPIKTFHQILGLDEKAFVAASNASFKLGIKFENWTQQGSSYYHAFGETGLKHWAASFQHYWLSAHIRGMNYAYDSFNPEATAADRGVFSHDCGITYAYHFDSAAYAKLLLQKCERAGVRRVEGKISKVNQDSESGNIESLELSDGRTFTGDFFIDCTGFRALLIGEALGVPFEDWSHHLFCDRAIAVQTERINAPVPYTRAIAHEAGWRWRIPLNSRTGNGIVYSSAFLDDEAALDKLLSSVDGEVISKPNHIRFTPGMRREHWKNNCLAIGLSAGFLEPLESTSIFFIHEAILNFIRHQGSIEHRPDNVSLFNRKICDHWDKTKDFIILHYLLNNRPEPFWQQCRDIDVPESLKSVVDLFATTGCVFDREQMLFREESWVQVMLGQGLRPENLHQLASGMSDDELKTFLDGLHLPIEERLKNAPTHEQYLMKYMDAN